MVVFRAIDALELEPVYSRGSFSSRGEGIPFAFVAHLPARRIADVLPVGSVCVLLGEVWDRNGIYLSCDGRVFFADRELFE